MASLSDPAARTAARVAADGADAVHLEVAVPADAARVAVEAVADADRGAPGDEEPLDERKRTILRAIVSEFVSRG